MYKALRQKSSALNINGENCTRVSTTVYIKMIGCSSHKRYTSVIKGDRKL